MKANPVQVKNVLITGCSSGIGLATARMLRASGWNVAPTVRKKEDLDTLRADGFAPIELDVADPESVKHAAAAALEQFGGKIGGLVNNAGFGQAGAVEDVNRETLRRQFEVNVFGAHDLTARLIPTFRKQGWGRIVNISSVLGRVVIPFFGSYSAAKYALEALSDALRVELSDSGVTVSIVEPGPILTKFRQTSSEIAEKTLDLANARYGASYQKGIERRKRLQKDVGPFVRLPEDVSRKIQHALESSRPRIRYCVTVPAHLGAFAARFVPTRVMDVLWTRAVRRMDAPH